MRRSLRTARAWRQARVTRPALPAHDSVLITPRERARWAASVRCARRREAIRRAAEAEARHWERMRDIEGAE